MAAWNPRRDHLAAAVDGALGQGGSELELIVIDDGSEPAVERLLGPRSDPRLRMVRVDHGGVYQSRNVGLEHARGDYVRYADSDDIVERGSTAHLLELAADRKTVSYGATLFCDAELRPQRTLVCAIEGSAVTACLLGRFEVRITSLLFPRRVVEAVGEWDTAFRVSGDWDYVLRALEVAPVRGDDQIATRYRRHAGSMIRQARVVDGEDARRRVIDRYFERHPDLKGSRLEREARALMLLDTAKTLRQMGDHRAFWSRIARAAPLDPGETAARLARLGVNRARRLRR
jgi:glycosyltransferase involved in cell wall biosynthesis